MLLELVLGAITGAFLLHRKDLVAESYKNKHKNTWELEFNSSSGAVLLLFLLH